jgi:hypothetical protein
MGKKEKLVLAATALATAVTSIFGGGSERANATEHINPPRPPADHQLNNFENPDPSQVEFPATQAKNSQAQTSPSLPRLEQEQQVEVVHIADLNEVVLSDEDFQALLPLWQEAFPDSDPTAELEQGGVSELPVSFASKSLDSLPANVSERVLKIRTRLNDIISQSASESEIQDIFELNLAFYLKNNEVRLIVSARNTINLADELNAGSIVFIDSIGNLRYIEPAEGEQAGFLKADKQTADEASQGYGTMPDGLPAQFIVPEGAVVLTTYIDDEGQERVRVTALLVEGTALVFPDEEQAGQNIARITTPAPNQRAPGHAKEVVAPEEDINLLTTSGGTTLSLDAKSWENVSPEYVPQVESFDEGRIDTYNVYMEWLAVTKNTPGLQGISLVDFLNRRAAGEEIEMIYIARNIETGEVMQVSQKLGKLTYTGNPNDGTLRVTIDPATNPKYETIMANVNSFFDHSLSYKWGAGSATGIFFDPNKPSTIIKYAAVQADELWQGPTEGYGMWYDEATLINLAFSTSSTPFALSLEDQTKIHEGFYSNANQIPEANKSPGTPLGIPVRNFLFVRNPDQSMSLVADFSGSAPYPEN